MVTSVCDITSGCDPRLLTSHSSAIEVRTDPAGVSPQNRGASASAYSEDSFRRQLAHALSEERAAPASRTDSLHRNLLAASGMLSVPLARPPAPEPSSSRSAGLLPVVANLTLLVGAEVLMDHYQVDPAVQGLVMGLGVPTVNVLGYYLLRKINAVAPMTWSHFGTLLTHIALGGGIAMGTQSLIEQQFHIPEHDLRSRIAGLVASFFPFLLAKISPGIFGRALAMESAAIFSLEGLGAASAIGLLYSLAEVAFTIKISNGIFQGMTRFVDHQIYEAHEDRPYYELARDAWDEMVRNDIVLPASFCGVLINGGYAILDTLAPDGVQFTQRRINRIIERRQSEVNERAGRFMEDLVTLLMSLPSSGPDRGIERDLNDPSATIQSVRWEIFERELQTFFERLKNENPQQMAFFYRQTRLLRQAGHDVGEARIIVDYLHEDGSIHSDQGRRERLIRLLENHLSRRLHNYRRYFEQRESLAGYTRWNPATHDYEFVRASRSDSSLERDRYRPTRSSLSHYVNDLITLRDVLRRSSGSSVQ